MSRKDVRFCPGEEPYSWKFMRRRRDWKRGLERILVGCGLVPKTSAFPALTFTLCLFV